MSLGLLTGRIPLIMVYRPLSPQTRRICMLKQFFCYGFASSTSSEARLKKDSSGYQVLQKAAKAVLSALPRPDRRQAS